MTRFTDGPPLTTEDFKKAVVSFAAAPAVNAAATAPALTGYSFLFDDLQEDPKSLLPETPDTAAGLIKLGRTMFDPDPASAEGNSTIPSAYTYFGQFIDHDLTRQLKIAGDDLQKGMSPLPSATISQVMNGRSPLFDLDCVYGPATEPNANYDIPRVDGTDRLLIERAQGGPPFTDLPRDPDITKIHLAFIGDRRNDENLIISQMHVAFLRAHNRLVDEGASFNGARTMLRRLYQYITVNDYLPRIADPAIVKKVLLDGGVFEPKGANVPIPLEFSVAAFRAAHSMIRNVYNYNDNLRKARLFQLFLPGPLKEYQHIIASWIIDWPRFFDGRNVARRLSPKIAPDLRILDPHVPFDLASIDLLRGYLYRLPTGEAVAQRLGVTPMSFSDIAAVTTPQQQQALKDGGFENRTPLWFYLLCEAAATPDGRLGTVGSSIVASVMIGLVRNSQDSYLQIENWTPPFGKGKDFDLEDLIQFAGVL